MRTMKTASCITLLSIGMVIALSSFTTSSGSTMKANPKPVAETSTTAKEVDVQAFMASLGLPMQVDAQQLEQQYPGVSLAFQNGNGVEIKFANPTAQEYRLDIYDMNGNILVSYVDIYGDTVEVDSRFVGTYGSYLYKLTGEGNTYAGKFSAQLP